MNSATESQQKRLRISLLAVLGVAITAGALAGLLALLAPLGVWLGMWDFRRGFDMLRMANNHADWIAILCLVCTVAATVAAHRLQVRLDKRLPILAGVATIAAALAYFYPQSFAAPAGSSYPPIHDISTDTVNPPQFVAVLPLRADAPNSAVYGDSPRLDAAELARLTREAYPDLQPWRTDRPAAEVFDRALAAVDELGWELVDENRAEGRIEATDTTFWFRFKDDVIISITTDGGQTLVNARSVSRVGTGDVGTNAKRLRAFLTLLQP
ncbi:MAG: hypothetical protein RLZZ385_549 [Pseudomonadota bacterium]